MRRFFSLCGVAAALSLSACSPSAERKAEPAEASERMVAPVLLSDDAKDERSFARPAEARVTHVALDLVADFRAKRLGGIATLDLETATDAREIVLDSKGLEIEAVTDGQGRPLPWSLGQGDEDRGRPLIVQLAGSGPVSSPGAGAGSGSVSGQASSPAPAGSGSGSGQAPSPAEAGAGSGSGQAAATQIKVRYKSAANAEALQWLSPAQTAGRQHPFLFSQGQAILNRTWIPTQDSPGIRQTWEARVVVPEPLKVVMSGENLAPEGDPAGDGRRAFRFRMDKPVAPYLIAIAAGDIAFQSLGPRTGVYAEPATIKRAAAELGDTEKMVEAAERLYGPYRWGRYDMIVLPPAFPYGGMENPRLTFLTPTFIAGDKSLVGLVAHELAHSWSGNLVTNAVWADSWLNEGFTSYFENRIMEAMYGPRRAAQEAALSFTEIETSLKELGATAPGTRLHNPDEGADGGSSGIVYDKGAAFLRTIERAVGRERFDRYLRSYFDRHAFQPMTSARFLADLRANLVKGDPALEERLKLDVWVYRPGLPDNVARPDPQAFAHVDEAVQAFNAGGPAGAVPYAGWNTAERLRFLNALPRELSRERLTELEGAFRLNQSGNSEVLFAWLQLALANRYEPSVPAAERFLMAMGRRKFVAPLFETLVGEGEWGRPIAERVYARARPSYHAVTTGTVDKALGQDRPG